MSARLPEQSKAHHDPAGGFRNPWPDSHMPGARALVRMLRERRGDEQRSPTPTRGAFPTAVPVISLPRAEADAYTATWIGHSTILLQVGGLNVITDPVFSERAFPVQWAGPRRVMAPALAIASLPPIDVVLLSHSHYDHFDKPATKWLAKHHPDATWGVPLQLGKYLKGVGGRHGHELDWWGWAGVEGGRGA